MRRRMMAVAFVEFHDVPFVSDVLAMLIVVHVLLADACPVS